ncbi:MAG: DUF1559 domain-containing protein, partial [Thermoguttaceae bacterium]|nr:DUF1559 domain-containing protein [Thermoguttaceae bacterium]
MKNWFWQNAQGATSEPSTLADLIDAARRGEIGASTQVSNDGETWKSAADVPALADALGLDVSPTSGAEPASENADSTAQKKRRSGCAVVGGVCCVLLICVALGFRFVGLETARRALLASDWGRRVLLESERGRRTICANNLEKVALGVQIYGDLNEVLPPAYTVDAEGRPLHSWRVLILPYLGEEAAALYEQIRLDEPWDSEWNARFHSRAPDVFVCPSFGVATEADGAPVAETTCSVVVGDETAFPGPGNWRKWEDFADGLLRTLCVVERKTPVCWMEPTRELTLETLAAEVGSGHKAGFNAAFFDGCV